MCHLILLRHGETAGQSSIRFFGSTDIELSEFGKNQMRLAASLLGQQPYRSIITSPLKRSREGASIICGSDNPMPVIIEDFREINFGEFEGMTREKIKENYPDFYPQWQKSGSTAQFPGGESKTEFYGRVKKAALDVFNRAELPALAVLHKGVIRGILSALLDISAGELTAHPIELGSIHRLRKSNGAWELIATNEIGHLGKYRIEHS